MKFLKRLFIKPKTSGYSLDEAIKEFCEHPYHCFTYRGQQFDWTLKRSSLLGEASLDDMKVVSNGFTLGYVERVNVFRTTAQIGHIAVPKDATRQGIGPLIAKAYARALADKFGVDRILFTEDHTEYHTAGYPGFLSKIGAKPLPANRFKQKTDRPDFEWTKDNW